VSWFRIASSEFPHFSGNGSKVFGGRWTSPGRSVIYCGETVSTCRLELLAHLVRRPKLPSHVVRKVIVPSDLRIEELKDEDLPSSWDDPMDYSVARTVGDVWFDSRRSVGLIVPSVPAGGDRNLIINEAHSDFHKLIVSAAYPLTWDKRLFPFANP
jgi:RES domain-containing protein